MYTWKPEGRNGCYPGSGMFQNKLNSFEIFLYFQPNYIFKNFFNLRILSKSIVKLIVLVGNKSYQELVNIFDDLFIIRILCFMVFYIFLEINRF